jgi:hypothetical protein
MNMNAKKRQKSLARRRGGAVREAKKRMNFILSLRLRASARNLFCFLGILAFIHSLCLELPGFWDVNVKFEI